MYVWLARLGLLELGRVSYKKPDSQTIEPHATVCAYSNYCLCVTVPVLAFIDIIHMPVHTCTLC